MALIAREIVELAYELDYFGMRDNYASEAAAEADTAYMLEKDPALVVAFLESFGIPAADHIIERINSSL